MSPRLGASPRGTVIVNGMGIISPEKRNRRRFAENDASQVKDFGDRLSGLLISLLSRPAPGVLVTAQFHYFCSCECLPLATLRWPVLFCALSSRSDDSVQPST